MSTQSAAIQAHPPVAAARVKAIDHQPATGLILAAMHSGAVQVSRQHNRGKTLLKTIKVAEGPVRAVRFLPNAAHFVCGSDDGHLRVVDHASGRVVASVAAAHGDYIRAIAVDTASGRMLTCADDKTVKLWDCADITRGPVATYTGHHHYVMAVVFDPTANGEEFASASLDGTVKIWRINSPNEPIRTIQAHNKGINALGYSSSSPWLLATGSDDQTVGVWDLRDGGRVATLSGHAGNVTSVAFDPKGEKLVSGGEDARVRVWRLGQGSFELVSVSDPGLERPAGMDDYPAIALGSKTLACNSIRVRLGTAWRKRSITDGFARTDLSFIAIVTTGILGGDCERWRPWVWIEVLKGVLYPNHILPMTTKANTEVESSPAAPRKVQFAPPPRQTPGKVGTGEGDAEDIFQLDEEEKTTAAFVLPEDSDNEEDEAEDDFPLNDRTGGSLLSSSLPIGIPPPNFVKRAPPKPAANGVDPEAVNHDPVATPGRGDADEDDDELGSGFVAPHIIAARSFQGESSFIGRPSPRKASLAI
ncbi:Coatomer subunit beta' [Irineochytrium annulatum]|nr:Coatomer subunit beta' [Irineochytrium annulatum]